jgi:hypothetical protein
MSFFEKSLIGKEIHSVHVDSEITCMMLSDGTQITIRGWVVVERGPLSSIIEATVAGERVPRNMPRIVGH